MKTGVKAGLIAIAAVVTLGALPSAQAQDGPPNVVPERVQPHGKAKLPHWRHHHKHHRHHRHVQPNHG